MPPAKLTYHVTLNNGRHLLLMPLEDLEPSYILTELTPGEVGQFEMRFGPAPDWMERVFWDRELRQSLPSRFRRTSRCGDFGAIHPESEECFKSQIVKGFGLSFDSQRIPGIVEAIERYPQSKPDGRCLHLDAAPQPGSRPLPSDLIPQPILPDVVEVDDIDEGGRVRTRNWGTFTWSTGGRGLDLARLHEVQEQEPDEMHLVRCLSYRGTRYLACFFRRTNVLVLVCPVKQNATFWGGLNGTNPSNLPRLLPDKATAKKIGFGRLLNQGGYLKRIGQIISGRPLTWRDHGKDVAREVQTD